MREAPPVVLTSGLFLLFDQLGNCLAGLGAFGDPTGNLFAIEFESGAGARIVGAHLFNVAPVAGKAPIAHDNTVERPLLGPVPAQSNSYTHACDSFSCG